MNASDNDKKFNDVKFSIPEETVTQRNVRLAEMSASLIKMIKEIKDAVPLTEDAGVKDQLDAVVKSLHDVHVKVEKAIQ